MNSIDVNIWDDYLHDDFVFENDTQETWIEVESTGDLEFQKEFLEFFKIQLEKLSFDPSVKFEMYFYDSYELYPTLKDSEYPQFVKWKIMVYNLTHERRERLLKELELIELFYNDMVLNVYSES